MIAGVAVLAAFLDLLVKLVKSVLELASVGSVIEADQNTFDRFKVVLGRIFDQPAILDVALFYVHPCKGWSLGGELDRTVTSPFLLEKRFPCVRAPLEPAGPSTLEGVIKVRSQKNPESFEFLSQDQDPGRAIDQRAAAKVSRSGA